MAIHYVEKQPKISMLLNTDNHTPHTDFHPMKVVISHSNQIKSRMNFIQFFVHSVCKRQEVTERTDHNSHLFPHCIGKHCT